MKGEITTEYTVWCANDECVKWYQEAYAKNKTNAVKIFKNKGWKKTTNGWVCPNCKLNDK